MGELLNSVKERLRQIDCQIGSHWNMGAGGHWLDVGKAAWEVGSNK